MPLPWLRCPHQRSRAFTIIEMLTVIAIIGILMAILIPTVTGSSTNAKRAKTKVQFNQWAVAIEGFRQEYGYYPAFAFTDGKINPEATDDTEIFVQSLSGRKALDGTPGDTALNPKRIMFCTFSASDLTSESPPRLQDAFGNKELVVLVDRNQDGTIRVQTNTNDDYPSVSPAIPLPPSVKSIDGKTVDSPAPSGTIIRAGVAIYSAGDGDQPVKSW